MSNTINESKKILAAIEVAESSPLNENNYSDEQWLKALLPSSYKINSVKGGYRCVSPVGILGKGDAEDNEHWKYIMKAIKQRFKSRFREVFHNTSFAHKDFIIHIRKTDSNKLLKNDIQDYTDSLIK